MRTLPIGFKAQAGNSGAGRRRYIDRGTPTASVRHPGCPEDRAPSRRGAGNFEQCGTGQSLQWAMELSERQRKYLRGLGHALNPVILIGSAGVTPAVIAETQRALSDHELIKVKFRGADREIRDAGLIELATATESLMLQRIGHTALYYKRRIDRPGIVIPDA
jgi:RNA-binding protein